MQHITYISQDEHNNLRLRYFEKNKDMLIEIPRYGTDRWSDDAYIARLVNDIANRKDKIKYINDSFRNHTRYKQITIDGRTVVLENPVALLQRADFANLAISLRDKKNEMRLKEAKLTRRAIGAIAIGSAIAALAISASKIGVPSFQINKASDTTATMESDESILSQNNNTIETAPTVEFSTIEDNKFQDLQNQNDEQLTTQPSPIVIPDDVQIDYSVSHDVFSPEESITVTLPESESTNLISNNVNEVNNLQLLSDTYGMTEDQILQICNSKNLDIKTSSFSSLQNAVSDVYWKNPEQFTPVDVSSTQKDIEQEIYKAAVAYNFTSDEEIATLIAISRLETGYYTSEKFCNLNNLGGVHINSEFIQYNTIPQGAIGLVKTVSNLKNDMIQQGVYNYDQSLATNIGPQYCPSDQSEVPWAPEVDKIKNKMLSTGELMEIRNGQSQLSEKPQGVTR